MCHNMKPITFAFLLFLLLQNSTFVHANSFKLTIENQCMGLPNSDFMISGKALVNVSTSWYGKNSGAQKVIYSSSERVAELFFQSRPSDSENMNLEFTNHFCKFNVEFVAHKNWSGIIYIPKMSTSFNTESSNDRYDVTFHAGKNSYVIRISPKKLKH